MLAKRQYDPETKAAVMAALLTGQSVGAAGENRPGYWHRVETFEDALAVFGISAARTPVIKLDTGDI